MFFKAFPTKNTLLLTVVKLATAHKYAQNQPFIGAYQNVVPLS